MRAQYMPLILQGTNPERNPALYQEPWKADGIEKTSRDTSWRNYRFYQDVSLKGRLRKKL